MGNKYLIFFPILIIYIIILKECFLNFQKNIVRITGEISFQINYFQIKKNIGNITGEVKQCLKNSPKICISIISCNRLNYLKKTVKSLFQFLEKFETKLCYKIIWIDQGTQNKEEIYRNYNFDLRVFYSTRQGYPISFQTAFEQCISYDYFLPIEEDWDVRFNNKESFISNAIQILESAPYEMYGIILRYVCTSTERLIVNTTKFGQIPMFRVTGWIRFANGPVVYRMKNIREMLNVSTYVQAGSEYNFAQIAKNKGFYYAFPYGTISTKKSPSYWPGYFAHIGKHSTKHFSSKNPPVYE